jgi:hypothetical protein
VVEKLGDGRLAVKVVGLNNSRQQDEGKGGKRGGRGAVLNDNIEEAGGHRVELVLPCAVDGEQAGTEERERRASSSKGLGTVEGMRRSS